MGDTLRKSGKRLVVFLLLSSLFLQPGFFPVAAADFSIRLTVPVRVEFELSTDFVDLGPPRTQNNILYYEQKNAVRLSFRTNLASGWEIHVTGSDFSAGDDPCLRPGNTRWWPGEKIPGAVRDRGKSTFRTTWNCRETSMKGLTRRS